MPPTRRRSARPNAEDLADLNEDPSTGGRLRKAPVADAVLGVATAPAAAQEQPPPVRRTGGAKTKVGFYQDPDDIARARAAYDWTRPHTKHRSFSDFIAAALMREVQRLEAEYNNGQPWPAMEPGELPTGKPLGA